MSEPTEFLPDRDQRLAQIREQVLKVLASGRDVDAPALRSSQPDLEPELSSLLAELLGEQPTQAGGPGATAAGQGGTVTLEPTEHAGGPAAPRRSSAPAPEPTVEITHGSERTQPAEQTMTMGTSPGGSSVGFREATRPADPHAATAAGDFDLNEGGDSPGMTVVAPGEVGEVEPRTGTRVRYIGDYELGKELGRGGMGVVFKARQVSLNRPVALKMIRNAEFASEDQLRRFQNEAEAVAMLDHPGIVPIYEVGEYKDLRYFSMKLIEGAGLDRKLEVYAADPRAAATLMAAIADAVFHAHQRGILHRDLKPANILIDGQDAPHVTDFGLAKRIEGDAGLTVSGAIMGTPSYMAPEQALGRTREITTATDIYGLGAILYAVLTGQAPFRGDSVLETLEQVRQRPPESPRQHNATLPRDLEVICLKCLEKDPRQRYETARELADDLERWLRFEPIKARPVGPLTRLRMWGRRNPALAALSAGLVFASIAGIIGITVAWREAVMQRALAVSARDDALDQKQVAQKAEAAASTARDAAVASETAAQAARKQAETNAIVAATQANLALQTIQDMILRLQAINDPALADFKADILKNAQARIDQVSNLLNTPGTSKEATTAAALTELAKIYIELGQTERGYELLQRCNGIYRERLNIKNRNDASRLNLASNLRELARVSVEYRRDLATAQKYDEESLVILEDILKNPRTPNPGDIAFDPKVCRSLIAEAHMRVGSDLVSAGDLVKGRDSYRKAANIRREMADADPKDLSARRNLGYSVFALAELAFRLGDDSTALDQFRRALELREELSRNAPKSLDVQRELGDVHYIFGWFELRSGRFASAREHLEESRKIRQQLVDREPRNVANQRALGLSHYYLGVTAERAKDEPAAKAHFEACRKIRQTLADNSPENDRRKMELMLILARTGAPDPAVAIADRLAAGPKVDNELRNDLARCYALAARALGKDQAERARALGDRAIEQLRAAVTNGFRDPVLIKTDADFDGIQARPEFIAVVSDMTKR